jgi:arsenite methyltransferase
MRHEHGRVRSPRSAPGLAALWDNFRRTPDRAVALDRYDTLALNYEASTTRIRAVRAQAIELLGLQPGETVFDVACGAGAILPALSWRVGPAGRVIGIEQSTAMAAQARSAALTLDNAVVLCDAVETFVAGRSADALILCYTHDVLQSPAALDNLLRQARPGARVVLAGLCLAPWWAAPANAWVLWGAQHYLTTWRGLRQPWALLAERCADLQVVSRCHGGTGYLARGTVP